MLVKYQFFFRLGLKSFKLYISMDIEFGNPKLNLTNVEIRPLLGLATVSALGMQIMYIF